MRSITITASWEEGTFDDIYPGGQVIVSEEDIIKGAVADAKHKLEALLTLRYQTAVSGAMRWPWSQEAVISVKLEVRVV